MWGKKKEKSVKYLKESFLKSKSTILNECLLMKVLNI